MAITDYLIKVGVNPGKSEEILKGLALSFSKLGTGVKSLIPMFLPFQGLIQGLANTIGVASVGMNGLMMASTMTAARTQVLGTIMKSTGENVGLTNAAMKSAVDEMTRLGIATQDAQSSVIRLAQAEVKLSDGLKLARVAQDLAVISGQNSSEAYSTIIDSISSYNTMLLRSFGLTKNLSDIISDYAKANKRTVASITDLEAKQAMVNYILQEGTKAAGNYEKSMEDVGKKMTSFSRLFEEFRNTIGQYYLPYMSLGVSVAYDLLNAFNKLDPKMKAIATTILGIGSTIGTIVPIVVSLGFSLSAVSVITGMLSGSGSFLSKTLAGLMAQFLVFTGQCATLDAALVITNGMLVTTSASMKGLASSTVLANIALKGFTMTFGWLLDGLKLAGTVIAAVSKWLLALALTPFGLVIAGLTAITILVLKLTQNQRDAAKASKEFSDSMALVGGSIKKMRIEEMNKGLKEARDNFKAGKISVDEYSIALVNNGITLDKLKNSSEEYKKVLKAILELMENGKNKEIFNEGALRKYMKALKDKIILTESEIKIVNKNANEYAEFSRKFSVASSQYSANLINSGKYFISFDKMFKAAIKNLDKNSEEYAQLIKARNDFMKNEDSKQLAFVERLHNLNKISDDNYRTFLKKHYDEIIKNKKNFYSESEVEDAKYKRAELNVEETKTAASKRMKIVDAYHDLHLISEKNYRARLKAENDAIIADKNNQYSELEKLEAKIANKKIERAGKEDVWEKESVRIAKWYNNYVGYLDKSTQAFEIASSKKIASMTREGKSDFLIKQEMERNADALLQLQLDDVRKGQKIIDQKIAYVKKTNKDWMKSNQDLIDADLANKKRGFNIEMAMLQRKIDKEKEAADIKKSAMDRMNDYLFKATHTEMENAIKDIQDEKKAFEDAGADKVKIAEWVAQKLKDLAKGTADVQIQSINNVATASQVASSTFDSRGYPVGNIPTMQSPNEALQSIGMGSSAMSWEDYVNSGWGTNDPRAVMGGSPTPVDQAAERMRAVNQTWQRMGNPSQSGQPGGGLIDITKYSNQSIDAYGRRSGASSMNEGQITDVLNKILDTNIEQVNTTKQMVQLVTGNGPSIGISLELNK